MSGRTIELIARGVLKSELGILLCQSVKRGYYYLPGGHVEFGEPAADALAREFLEETGLQVTPTRLLGTMEASFTDSKARHEVNLVFHVEHLSGAISKSQPSREAEIAFAWLRPEQLDLVDFRPKPMLDIVHGKAGWVGFAKVE